MTKGELTKMWKGIPSSVRIFVEADHGQQVEHTNGIEYTQEDIVSNMEIDEVNWKYIKPSTNLKRITAILIV